MIPTFQRSRERAAALLVLIFCAAAIGVFLTSATSVYVREVTLRTQERAQSVAREAAEGEMARAISEMRTRGGTFVMASPAVVRPEDGGSVSSAHSVEASSAGAPGRLFSIDAHATFTDRRGFVASWEIRAEVEPAGDGRLPVRSWEEGVRLLAR